MFDCEGGAEKVVRLRTSVAWFKWRELNSLFSNKSIQLNHRDRAYNSWVRSTITYGAATWALTQREEQLLQSCDRRMLRMVCEVSLSDCRTSIEILRRCRLEDILWVVSNRRLVWLGYIYRRGWPITRKYKHRGSRSLPKRQTHKILEIMPQARYGGHWSAWDCIWRPGCVESCHMPSIFFNRRGKKTLKGKVK